MNTIGKYAFWGCNNLTAVTIPNSVKSIGDQAFYNCQKLASIEMPNSNVEIGDFAFPQHTNASLKSNVTMDSNPVGVYKVVDKHGEVTYFKLETTSAGENNVKIKYVSKKGEVLSYDGMVYTYWGKWEKGEKNGESGLILRRDNEKSIRDLYMSFRGVIGEMHSMVFISYKGLIYSYHEDNPKLEIEKIETFAETSDKEIAKENKYRQEVAQQHDRMQTVDDGDNRKAIGEYSVKDAVKTTYLKLDTNGKVYFKYEGKCLGKVYHNDEYVYWGSWKIEKSTLGKRIKLKQDMNNIIRWLFIYFPCYELIEDMQSYSSLEIDLNDGRIYGGRCSSSIKTTKIQ